MLSPSFRIVILSADLEDLLQEVGDVDDPDPLGLEAADQVHERVRLLQAEGAGRLVHDDDLGLPVTGLHDLQHLLLRRGEVLHQRIFVQVEVKGADEIAAPARSASGYPP